MSTVEEQLFERSLLESARADDPPPTAAAGAWLRFSSTIAEIAATGAAGAQRPSVLDDKAVRRVSHVHAAKWLLIGALGGGVLTAAVIGSRPMPSQPATVPLARSQPASSVAQPARLPVMAAPSSSSSNAGLESGQPTTPAALPAAERRALRAERSAKWMPSAQTAPPGEARAHSVRSALGQEVSALDAARAALAAREFDQTLQLIDSYRRDFPSGELCADADVVAIEALFAKGDRAAALRQAARFLDQHPNDPHSEGVRRWAQ